MDSTGRQQTVKRIAQQTGSRRSDGLNGHAVDRERIEQQTGARRSDGLNGHAVDRERIEQQTCSRWADGLSRQAAGSERDCATDRQQTFKWTEQAGSRQCEADVNRQQAV
jgi:hypothetical protein